MAVLIESSRSFGRGALLGVAQYARERANWRVDYQERELQSGLPGWLEHWHGHGVLARIENDTMAQRLFKLGVPIVDLRCIVRDKRIASFQTHEIKVAQLVVEHFEERGFQRYGFCGYPGLDYSDTRAHLLSEELARRGFKCDVYTPPGATPHVHTVDYEQGGMEAEDHLVRWLKHLPKPVAVMACNDIRGQQVLNACRAAGIAVPDQIAVIGVDNDEVLCDLSDPPLSSVVPDTHRIGYEAAALLDRLMRGQQPATQEFNIEPLRVITRRSTDILVIPHPGAAMALAFLRRHYQEPITLKDVAASLPVTLRSIQDIFKQHVGHSLHNEIDQLRVRRAKHLLQDSRLALKSVAAACGFSDVRHFRRTFLRETGISPRDYRGAI